MYKSLTKPASILAAATVSLSLLVSGNAMAGPGKPGNNPIVPDGNIVEIALAANALLGEFDYLLGAVGCLTDEDGNNPVVDLLTGDDKVTLFAPTDAAFERLQTALGIAVPSPELTCLVDGIFGPGTVLAVLGYHVTEGRRFSNSVFNRNETKEIEMLLAGSIITTPDLTIWDGAGQEITPNLSLVNINAINGVIHVVDTVMLPFAP